MGEDRQERRLTTGGGDEIERAEETRIRIMKYAVFSYSNDNRTWRCQPLRPSEMAWMGTTEHPWRQMGQIKTL